jgi:transposase
MQDLRHLAFVGIDNHKDQHTACVTDCFSRNLGTFDIGNEPTYFKELTSRVNMISNQNNLRPVFGLEDTQNFGQELAKFLVSSGNYVKEVPSIKTERKRAKQSHPDKSDADDALAIAKVLIQDFDKLATIDSFNELHLAIKELSNQRESLVKEQTMVKNRLHLFIHKQYPRYQKMFKTTFSKSALCFWERFSHPSYLKGVTVKSLANFLRNKSNKTISTKAAQRILSLVSAQEELSDLGLIRSSVIKGLVRHLRFLQDETALIEKELKHLVSKTGLKLETLTGVNTTVAAKLISYIGDINRFSSSDKLAKCAGIAPTKKSSGKKLRHKKSWRGHRRLNSTIYYIGLTQIGKCRDGKPQNAKAREYYLRKIAEGKSKKEALTCLMRRLCDIIYAMMKNKTEYHQP